MVLPTLLDPAIKSRDDEGEIQDTDEKRPLQHEEVSKVSDVVRMKKNWLLEVDTSQTPQVQHIQLLMRMYKRKRKRFELSIDQPFPHTVSKPSLPKNIARQAIDVKTYLHINPGQSFSNAAKHFNITTARVSQLVKIVENLPPDFIKELENSKDPILLRRFSGRRLLKLASFETREHMEKAIDSLIPA